MELHWSARDVIRVYESRRVPYIREFCRPCPVCDGVVISQNACTSVLNRFPMGDSIRSQLFQDYVCHVCPNEIPQDFEATFVRS